MMPPKAFARLLMHRFELAWVAKGCDKHFISLSQQQEDSLIESLVQHYYLGKGKQDPRTTPDLREDFTDAVYGTVNRNRTTVIPWLNCVRPLAGLRILEIGTGSGASMVPLAEQGAYVVGTDVDAESLAVARDRIRAYGLQDSTEIHLANAADLKTIFPGQQFDSVIFLASVEHITLAERWKTLPAAWSLLNRGGQLVIVETPNRLWWDDGHTSELPFYNWLPDEVAFLYRQHSRRKERNALSPGDTQDLLPFVGLGRSAPGIDAAFFEPYLDFCVTKP